MARWLQGSKSRCAPAALALAVAIAMALLPIDPSLASAHDQEWREDLRFMVQQLREIHPKLFFHVPEEKFEAAVNDLDRRIPELDDAQVIVGLMRVAALIGDGHTGLFDPGPRYATKLAYPVRLFPFTDGIFVQAVARPYAEYVGARVSRIGDLPAQEALDRLREVTSGDNEWTTLDRGPFYLTMPPVVRALGITPREDVLRLEVETSKGKRGSFEVRAVEADVHDPDWFFGGEGLMVTDFVTARGGAKAPPPLYLRERSKNYWFEYLPDSKLLWVQFNQVQNAEGEPFGAFCARMFDFADHHDIDKLVLDIRQNHGGNNQILKPLIHGLIKRDETINRRGHLFTIIGRGTFSAAMNCAAWLEEHTNTLYVGEPTGATPNEYGDHDRVELPHSRAMLFVSKYYWQNRLPWDRRPWIAPHVPAQLTSADYRANRDPALDAILQYSQEPTLAELAHRELESRGIEAAVAACRDYQKRHPDLWGRTRESDINALGYALLNEKKPDAAIAIFRLNLELYPKSANALDSLAEAYMVSGDLDRAVEFYEKALEVDPEFRNATIMLQRLGKR